MIPKTATCSTCSRLIRSSANRFIVHARYQICAMCVFNDKSPESLKQMHDLAAPACGIDWHDHWDHFERFIEGSEGAVMAFTAANA